MQRKSLRWKRWAAVAAGLLAVYAALGFWIAPWAVRHQIPKLGQSELGRQASVGQITFDPFTLQLVASDLRLAEADGSPLFAVGRLAAQLRWRSIVDRAWHFGQIRVTQPSADLAIASDGKFNFAQLLDTLQQRPREASAKTSLPRLIIDQFALEQGRVDMHDRRAGYDNRFAPLDFELARFSTLPEQNDAHTLSVDVGRGGGKVRWKGSATIDPIRGSGELALQDISLPDLAVYLKPYMRATLADGRLSATLPYTFSYTDGRFEADLTGAAIALRDLAVSRRGANESFAALPKLDLTGIRADLPRRDVTVDEIRSDGGRLRIQRAASGALDLADLVVGDSPARAADPVPPRQVLLDTWKLAIRQVLIDDLAVSAADATVNPPLELDAGHARVQLQLAATRSDQGVQVTVSEAGFSLSDLTLSSGGRTPLKIGRLGFADGGVDLAARRAVVGRLYAQDGQVQLARDSTGKIDVLDMLPRLDSGQAGDAAAASGQPWVADAGSVELSHFDAELADQASGVTVHVSDLAATLRNAGSDLKRPVQFDLGLALREGGQLSARGSVVPDSGSLQADVRLRQLALAPFQPLLARYVKLRIAEGSASASGRLTAQPAGGKGMGLRYTGGANVAGLVLKEEDGDQFATWKDVRADQLIASVAPNRLDIPELRIVEPDAKLIIESDRSLNAARLLVQPSGATAKAASKPTTVAQGADDPFPVRIRRVRLQNARLDFADLSLQPQFAAKIYELNGAINGLSSSRLARSQVEMDGRVDEFGSARIRGELNPFAPSDNTDLNVVFKNVDLVPTSPYTVKFAGYKVAQGKLSLDLQYKVRDRQLQGNNQIVIDNLTLGERVESPDALKLPLELAIAILKDSDGRIDLGLPVTGDLNDPQFSYAAIVWKAIGNLLTRIVTAPFRALGAMMGVSGEKLEAIDFDPGSDRLSPPEREKLQQVAALLAKRDKLKLSVPGEYSEQADGAALRARAVRMEIARRTGIKLEAGEEPGPLDPGDRAVRSAMRDLYTERFGEAALDEQKKSAERGSQAAMGAPASAAADAAPAKLPLWQRVGKMIQGEPQVADAAAFYRQLREDLERSEALAPDALTALGSRRAQAVVAALVEAGVDPSRAAVAAPQAVAAEAGAPVHLKLALGAS